MALLRAMRFRAFFLRFCIFAMRAPNAFRDPTETDKLFRRCSRPLQDGDVRASDRGRPARSGFAKV